MRAVAAGDAGCWRLFACCAQILRERVSQLLGAESRHLARSVALTWSVNSLSGNGKRTALREPGSNPRPTQRSSGCTKSGAPLNLGVNSLQRIARI